MEPSAPPIGTKSGGNAQTVRAPSAGKLNHARDARSPSSPPPIGDDQYMQNFFQAALVRQPNAAEQAYWDNILRPAYYHAQNSMVMAVREMGKAVFASAEYGARNRTDRDYVFDLYEAYLMRAPDQGGWDFWTAQVASMGRDQVRRAFDESTEFINDVATITPSGGLAPGSSLLSARVDPANQVGNQLLTRDAEWSLPLLSLPGRAGLDLGLSLAYSSQIWTQSGPYIYFDQDNGFPGPGFRLGFPTIQEMFFDAQAGQNAYVMITSSGRRVELLQVGSSNVYEATDSSYLQLTDNSSSNNTLLVQSPEGTQLVYSPANSEWRCGQVTDRNGNFITATYDFLGHIQTIRDTLGRAITFNYDSNANPMSIAQTWTVNGQQISHMWVSFGWGMVTMQPNFSGAETVGVASSQSIPAISMVGLDDGSSYVFNYGSNGLGQVSQITHFGSDSSQLAYTAFDYDSPTADCPRLNDTRVSAQNWTGINGVPSELTAQYIVNGDGSHSLTLPDGTSYKETYGTGWQHALVTQTATSSGSVQKQTFTTWTQDNTSISYLSNPRVTETNIYDANGNHRRTTIAYNAPFTLPSGASCTLPTDVYESSADGSTVLRRTHTDYNIDSVYLGRNIVGLRSAQHVCDGSQGAVPCNSSSGNSILAKTTFQYDESGSVISDGSITQHDDTNYGSGFLQGRANVSSVVRYDVQGSGSLTSHAVYNTAGSVRTVTDAANHSTAITYNDSFSDGSSHNAFAYPTTVTDADGFSTIVQYNYDFGAKTRVQGPPPQGQPQGTIQTFDYDGAARIQRVTTANTAAYTRYNYGPNFVESFSTINSVADEAYSMTVFDGMGQTIAMGGNHPGSTGGYNGQLTFHDSMGRMSMQSNPTESTGVGPNWPAAGDDDPANGGTGYVYTVQTYDWNGRPLVTTNTDRTQKSVAYGGCGCAGGQVATLTDEAGRQRRITADVVGRRWKTEVLNSDGSVYSTTENTFNVLDEVTLTRQFQGTDTSGTYQDTTMSYDGYGRLQSKHVPEQNAGTATVYNYNDDDTVHSITDARGASATYGYNNRHLITGVTYNGFSTADVGFTYDAAGNRTSMSDGYGSVTYQFDQLSRLQSETRYFSALGRSYMLVYDYDLAGQVRTLTDPFGSVVTYAHDQAGQLTDVTDSSGVQYATGMKYRAWGALKHRSYGNNLNLDLSYNSRLQMTQYDLINSGSGARVMGLQYRYTRTDGGTDNDGNLKYSHDLTNSNLDRTHFFDQANRQVGGNAGTPQYDGRSTFTSGPYEQSYYYDVWGNLTGQQWRTFETISFPGGSYYGPVQHGYQDTIVNNRNTASGWQYDADGRLLTSVTNATRNYSYDATGALISASEPNKTATQAFDGDGLRAKYVENSDVTYYVISTALGGQAITELDQYGQKKRGYVYQGGEALAKDEGGQMLWDQRDPSGMSTRLTDASGNVTSKVEMDPLGTQVDDTASYNYSGSTGYVQSPAGFYGNSQMAHDCVVPGLGVAVPCGVDPSRPHGLSWLSFLTFGLEGVTYHSEIRQTAQTSSSFRELDTGVVIDTGVGQPDTRTAPLNLISLRITWDLGFLDPPQNSLRPDVPDYVKNFYKTHQGTIDRCVNRVFGQKGDGTPDPAARIMERQTISNAPEISYEMSQFQLQGNTGVPDTLATFGIPSKLGHSTVYIANDVPVSTTDIAKAVFHELGNILSAKMSYKLTGRADPYAYGDPNGVPYPTASGPPFYDKDTGARLERCIFGPPK